MRLMAYVRPFRAIRKAKTTTTVSYRATTRVTATQAHDRLQHLSCHHFRNHSHTETKLLRCKLFTRTTQI